MASAVVRRVGLLLLALVTSAGLVIDAVVHLSLASEYDANRGSLMSQGDLFRAASAAALLAVLMLLITRRWIAWLLAFLVAGSALAAVLVYRYVDLGSIGPLPDMYEPFWFVKKELTTVAEGVAVVAAAAGLILSISLRRTPARPRQEIAQGSGR